MNKNLYAKILYLDLKHVIKQTTVEKKILVKGTLQRKLSCVKSGTNR